jgi:signal transduction histidine kinase
MRRGTPELLVAGLIALLLGSYVWYTQRVVRDWQRELGQSSRMFARVYHGFGDTANFTHTLLDLSEGIVKQGVPIIVTDLGGSPRAHANLPFDPDNTATPDDPRIRQYVAVLDAQNKPIVDSLVGVVHFGNTRTVQGLRVIPALQALTAAILLLAGFYIIRTRGNAARERLWAGMARESAHQLGTPLSSLAGWIELLEDRSDDPSFQGAMAHMRGDLERLDRVAHRFERIGRDPKTEEVDVGVIVERVATYFKARVPTLANTIAVSAEIDPALPKVEGDPVLIEWALEVLTKNAIDAMVGRGGRVRLSARPCPEGVCVQVADDGPGIPRELRARIFEPGFSTKQTGWGIGLSLAKRIVEENHGGTLALAPTDKSGGGATFEIILH